MIKHNSKDGRYHCPYDLKERSIETFIDELLEGKDVEKITLANIASRIGVSNAAYHHHFKSKQSFLDEVYLFMENKLKTIVRIKHGLYSNLFFEDMKNILIEHTYLLSLNKIHNYSIDEIDKLYEYFKENYNCEIEYMQFILLFQNRFSKEDLKKLTI